MRPNLTEQQYEAILNKHAVRGGVERTRDEAAKSVSATRSTGGVPTSRPERGNVKACSVRNGQLQPPYAGANPAPSPYKSKLEAAYAGKLELEKRAGFIKQFWYEPFSLWLPGKVRFKPDFLVQYADGPGYHTDVMIEPRLELTEVKGWSRNRRDGMTRLKMAAALFPCFTWKLVERVNGEWTEKVIA